MKNFKISFFVFIALGLLYSTNIFCQESLSKEDVQKYTEMVRVAEGTYQIQMIDTRSLPSIPLSLIQIIENKREETEVVYYQYKSNIRIKILPKQMINKKGFVLIDRINHISSKNL